MNDDNLGSIGEFGLIEQIKKMTRCDASVMVGIGDDTAVLKVAGGKPILFTTDMLIEDRHFRLAEATGFEIGWKAMAVNVSDIAAMGGLPTHAVVSVGLPKDLNVEFVKQIYAGLQSVAKKFHVNLVGGDTNASDKLVISVALLGTCERRAPIRRSGAKPGDVIFVTGDLGGSYASKKHLNFIPRIAEAQYLTRNFKIHSMIDISDGLASDIQRVAQASRVGAVLSKEAIPVSAFVRDGDKALSDGEDFELLFTLSPHEAARLTLADKPRSLASFSPVGKIVSKKLGVRLLRANGQETVLPEKGYNHFRDN